ncbi:DUF3263 domain-containing protein [Amycolatopsis sp. FDAARGOS 1241]|uniref:DUF3263 domain-containing protein n=1 Tax=Amycolatopsis sp. FDAARGOS 1241 TaxID=2778070 RepID=UPI0019527BD8|nr:DUF3263 domain-containing protein [Amycolatopsis sp. FDAARGOS 1241]QRP46717.1 DUF3263 domain-containing protein [Amycolatopsis sp. FDAARGOS 1241]
MDAAESMAGDQPSPPESTGGLTERELDILAFERQWWRHAGAKENAIRERFSLSSTRYYQLLNTLLDKPEAVAADPMLVKRLRKTRAARQRKRGARRLGIELS